MTNTKPYSIHSMAILLITFWIRFPTWYDGELDILLVFVFRRSVTVTDLTKGTR